MLYLRYIAAELRRRRGRTILTALGLGVGVGLVVTVVALSNGLDQAQSRVLEPLTGVGTDMSVDRPIVVSGSGEGQSFTPGQGQPGQPPQLSTKEQKELQKENGSARIGLADAGKPGHHFNTTSFLSTNLSFPEREAKRVDAVAGVQGGAGALTLNMIHASGKVPRQTGQAQFAGPPQAGRPNAVNIDQSTVSGVDTSERDLGLITPGQISKGRYLADGKRFQAVLSQSYADQQNLGIGDQVGVGNREFRVVGIATPPLGGQSSDVYVPLNELQKLSDRVGRINVVQVRADSADQVNAVADAIPKTFTGAQVTTTQDLANRVSGSLVDAKNLSNKLGTALAIVALAAAFLIATLLTLASVNKRTREIGTLKALGWRQWLVVRQISGESVAQGLLGGVAGAIVGIAGAGVVGAIGFSLDATVGGAQPAGGFAGPFGQGQVASGSSSVTLSAPVDVSVIVLAIALAVLGGLIAGAVGGGRAARLRPAEALRSVE